MNAQEIIAIGSDHAGYEMKQALAAWCKEKKINIMDVGCLNSNPVDYPDYAQKVSTLILSKKAQKGILVCGTGIGISIAANRHNGIRAAVCTSEFEARASRQHNDANIICFGARVLGIAHAISCLQSFLKTDFEGGRHQERLQKLDR